MSQINWKYKIGDNIIKKDKNGNIVTNFIITNTKIERKKIHAKKEKKGFYYGNFKYYEYHCNICGASHLWMAENKIGINSCSCCTGVTRIPGINTFGDLYPECLQYFEGDDAFNPELKWKDIYAAKCPICGQKKDTLISNLVKGRFYCDNCNCLKTKRPDLVKYIVNESDYNLPFSSSKEVLTRCPCCGFEKEMKLGNLCFQGYKCPVCGDGVSFSEKAMINLLNQLNVDFIYQLSSKNLKWCKKYKYDFYIEDKSVIIEVNGIQHYEDSFSRCGGRTSEEEQINDTNKKNLAIKNGIINYISLDCRYSDIGWVKKAILNSELNELYDLSLIDWEQCFSFATNSLIKQVCDYWNNNKNITTGQVANKFKLGAATVRKYLKIGAQFDWCSYDARKESEKKKKKVSIYKNEKCIGSFDSINELSREYATNFNIKLLVPCISRVCNGKEKQYKGFVFKFSEKNN